MKLDRWRLGGGIDDRRKLSGLGVDVGGSGAKVGKTFSGDDGERNGQKNDL